MSRYQLRPLGEFLTLERDAIEVEADQVFRTAGMYSFGRGLFEREPIRGNETSYTSLFRLKEGQFVISRLNGWEGAVDVVNSSLAGCHVSGEYPTFSVNRERCEPRFLHWIARWPQFWDQLVPRGSMVRRKRVQPSQLLEVEIPLPSIDEQRRTAATLDTASAKRIELATLSSRRERLMLALTKSLVMSHAQSAPRSRFGDLFELRRRAVTVNLAETYREVGIRSFGRGIFHKAPVDGATLGSKRVFAIQPGDLVISNVFAWEGAVAVAGDNEQGKIGSHRFMTWTPRSKNVTAAWAAAYLVSPQGVEQLGKASPGSAGRNKTLAVQRLEDVEVPLPPTRDQVAVGRLLSRLTELQVSIGRAKSLANAFTGALLNQVFSA